MKMTHVFKQLKKEYLAIRPSELLREHGWNVLKQRIDEEERAWGMRRALMLVASVILLVILGGAGTVYAAQSAKPGDRLYPVKIASERITTALVPKPWKDEAAGTILNRRVIEAQEAADRGDAEGTKRARQEYVRSVENLRSAGALTSDVATKAAEKAKERIDAITKDAKKEEKKEEKKDVVPTVVEIPPLPSVGL